MAHCHVFVKQKLVVQYSLSCTQQPSSIDFIWPHLVVSLKDSLLFIKGGMILSSISVCQRWRLHFEFVTSTEPIKEPERPTKPDETSTWRGPATVSVETMVWDLPVKIFPANPVHASSVTLLKTVNGITV